MHKPGAAETIELSVSETLRPQPPSPGWDQAVCAATARLNEGWVMAETRCHPAVAEELAAILCAYAA